MPRKRAGQVVFLKVFSPDEMGLLGGSSTSQRIADEGEELRERRPVMAISGGFGNRAISGGRLLALRPRLAAGLLFRAFLKIELRSDAGQAYERIRRKLWRPSPVIMTGPAARRHKFEFDLDRSFPWPKRA
jgi:hypothetical protein